MEYIRVILHNSYCTATQGNTPLLGKEDIGRMPMAKRLHRVQEKA